MQASTPNRLLASLTPSTRNHLISLCRMVDLPVNTLLYNEDQEPAEAFFLESGFASQVITLGNAGTVEVGVIGSEGLVGHTPLLGLAKVPGQTFMQAGGAGYVLEFKLLQHAFSTSEELRTRILEFVQEQTVTATYLAACNKLHDTESRLARWLLMVQDRLETDPFPLTQEFLAQMLGTRRMTVTTAAGALQRSGLIEYKRGQIRILDRERLEAAACECYGHVKSLYDCLYRS